MADTPLSLRAYLALTKLAPVLARPLLRRRLARGKEHPTRWQEKLGHPSEPRPKGPLIWLHAVGLGEVLSLRGLVKDLTDENPKLTVLVTSSTRHSAEVFAKNLSPRTIHQFLPLDAPSYIRRFLDHWRPDGLVWVEQDLWPGIVVSAHNRGIVQVMLGARMNAASFNKHRKSKRLFAALYDRMSRVTAQDKTTATYLTELGAGEVSVVGSLKPGAPALTFDATEHDAIRAQLKGRFVWIVASSYESEEALAIQAHDILRKRIPDALLILVPRQIDRDFSALNAPLRAKAPTSDDAIWVANSVGELGLFYRLSNAALIGGTFSHIEGHNPWEAACLGKPILHGPNVANFANDFATLDQSGAARLVQSAANIAEALQDPDFLAAGAKGQELVAKARTDIRALAQSLLHDIQLNND